MAAREALRGTALWLYFNQKGHDPAGQDPYCEFYGGLSGSFHGDWSNARRVIITVKMEEFRP